MSPITKCTVKGFWTAAVSRISAKHDDAMAAVAGAILILASLACVGGGDQAVTNESQFTTTDAQISGQVGLGGALALDIAQAKAVLASARVATDRGEYSTTTNSSGNFTLPVAGDKTYNLYVTANGYQTVVIQGIRVGSQQSRTINPTITKALASGEKTYVGSSQCKLCHATQYNRWATSPHRYGISAPGDSPGILPAIKTLFESSYDLVNTSAFAGYGSNAPRLSKSGDSYIITIGSLSYPVEYAMGYQWKQRYITKIGMAHYILPIQYNTATSGWVTYNESDWYSGTTPRYASSTAIETDIYKKNSWERKCMGCHSVTGIQSLKFAASPATGIEQHQAEWVEKGIGCEACHGPASAHVWGNGALGTTTDPYVVNPAKLTVSQRNDVCGQCHSRGLSVGKLAGKTADPYNTTNDTWALEYYYDGARTFRPGDTLVAGYTDGGGYWTDTYAEAKTSKQHHQQWNDFMQSGHTAPGAALDVTCGSCHDVHGPVGSPRQMKLSAEDNSVCLSCHGPNGSANQRFATSAAVTQHTGTSHTTYAPGTTGAGRCITCHMPYTAKSAINYDVRSHNFRVIRPHASRRFTNANQSETIPNSCQQSCHNANSTNGSSFGSGSPGALVAAQQYDSTVERPSMTTPDTATGVVTGTITVGSATVFSDTAGVWVSADFTNRSAVTSRTGSYYLSLDAPGTYTIRAMKPGYDTSFSETVNVKANERVTLNMTIAKNANAVFSTKPFRCGACHGAVWGAEWRNSGFDSPILSEAEDSTDLSSGHGLMVASPTSSCGPKCHEARGASRYLLTGDTIPAGFTNTGTAGRRSQTCEVCHLPHDAGNVQNTLKQYRTTDFPTGHFYGPNSSGPTQSMPFKAAYKATACIMCHNQRTAPRSNGAGMQTNTSSPSDSRPQSTPHVGNNAEGFFGILSGFTGASINFDSFPAFTPKNSTHSDTIWGNTLSWQAFKYSGSTPKLIAQNGVPVTRTNDTFTCNTCHMFSQNLGTISDGSNVARDGGHSWKPDIRACGVCHDPNYVAINPYTNNYKAGSSSTGDVGYWGTNSWGVNSSGTTLGFDRPVAALPHQRDNGRTTAGVTGNPAAGDGVSNDYDGDGSAEGAHTEAEHLFLRVMASMVGDTHSQTSGIGAGGTDSLGHTFLGGSPYWHFDRSRSKFGIGPRSANKIEADELRAAWNLVLLEHDEKNLGVHNLRFAVETLRATWTVLGRIRTGDTAWTPPGDDY